MLQELSDESRRMGLKMNIAKTKVMIVDNTPINLTICRKKTLKATYTWDNATTSMKSTRTKRYDEESWQDGRHTTNTGISSKATLPSARRDRCTTPECCRYDIWRRDLDTDQTSTEQICGRTDQNGKKYAQHHIQ